MPCGGWRNTEIRSVVFPLRKFIVYNWGGETDRQGTAASSARECGVAAAAVDKSCLTDCHPGNCSIPGIPVLHCSWNFLRFMSIECPFGLPWWLRGLSICLHCGRPGLDPWVGQIPWRRQWQPTPVLLPGESHGRRSLVGYSPWGRKESDTTERLHFMSIESVTLSNRLFLCCHPILLLLPSVFPSIRVFSNESVLHIRWPVYWSFSFSIRPSSVVQR